MGILRAVVGRSVGRSGGRPSVAGSVVILVAISIAGYFFFAAVQGEYGVLRRVQLSAEMRALAAERDALATELAQLTNLTHRLSDAYLDLDLLDERARSVLGYLRADEIVIR